MTINSPVIFLSHLKPISCSIQGCFLSHIQISQETGKMVWYSRLLKRFSEFFMIHTVKGFSIVGETKVDVFLEFPCFLHDTLYVSNWISGSSAFSKPSVDIWKFLAWVMLKLSMQDAKHDFTSMGDEWNCPVVLTHFNTILLAYWDKDWSFQVLWTLLGLPDLLTYWVQHFDTIIF